MKKGQKSKLISYLEKRKLVPFDEQKNNCAFFVADYILMMTEVDVASEFRDKFDSLRDGYKLLKKKKFKNLADFMDKNFTEVKEGMAFANIGDVILVKSNEEEILGILGGEMIFVLRPEGLSTIPRSHGIKAWSF